MTKAAKLAPSPEDLRLKAVAAVEKLIGRDEKDFAELISGWCAKAKAPLFDEDGHAQILWVIRDLLSSPHWRDEFSHLRKTDRSAQRTRDVIEALSVLRDQLPQFIEDWRINRPAPPLDLTASLYEMVLAHRPWIEALQPTQKGKPRSGERDVSTFLATTALQLWKGAATAAQADGFASEAVGWMLDRPQSDEAIAKARRRRAAPRT